MTTYLDTPPCPGPPPTGRRPGRRTCWASPPGPCSAPPGCRRAARGGEDLPASPVGATAHVPVTPSPARSPAPPLPLAWPLVSFLHFVHLLTQGTRPRGRPPNAVPSQRPLSSPLGRSPPPWPCPQPPAPAPSPGLLPLSFGSGDSTPPAASLTPAPQLPQSFSLSLRLRRSVRGWKVWLAPCDSAASGKLLGARRPSEG